MELPPVPDRLVNELIDSRQGQRYLCRLFRLSAQPISLQVAQRLDLPFLLYDESSSQLVTDAVKLYPQFATPLIDACLTKRDVPKAKTLLKAARLAIRDVPQLLAEAYNSAFNFFAFKEKMDPTEVARLVEGDEDGSVHFVMWAAYKGWTTVSANLYYLGMSKETQARVPVAMRPSEKDVHKQSWTEARETLKQCQSMQPHALPMRILRCLEANESTLNLHFMGMTLNDISILTTLKEVEEVTTAAKAADFVGLDCEWRATFVPGDPQPVCLMQMSFRDRQTGRLKAYLIDLKTSSEDGRVWRCLSDYLMDDQKGLCLGLSFASVDMGALRSSRPGLFNSLNAYSELCHLCQGHLCRHPKVLQDSSEFASVCHEPFGWKKSLDATSRLLLKRDINKVSQLTNWASRPLTVDQAIYAATDAAALVLMAEKILTENDDSWDVKNICTQALHAIETYKHSATKKETGDRETTGDSKLVKVKQREPWLDSLTKTPVFVCNQFKLVECLRAIGLDCRFPQEVEADKHPNDIYVFLLTDKSMKAKLTQFPLKYEFTSGNTNDRFRAVLRAFNLKVPPRLDDSMGRCIFCNNSGPWKMEVLSESDVEVRRCESCGKVEWLKAVHYLHGQISTWKLEAADG